MFRSLSFKFKIIVFSGALSALTAAVGILGYFNLQNIADDYKTVTNGVLPSVNNINQILAEFRKIRISLRTLGLSGVSRQMGDQEVAKALASIDKVESLNLEFRKFNLSDRGRVLYEELWLKWSDFKNVGARIVELQKIATPDSNAKMATIFLNDCPKTAEALDLQINKMLVYQNDIGKQWVEKAEDKALSAGKIAFLVVFLSAGFAQLLGYFLATALERSLGKVIDTLNQGASNVSAASKQIAVASDSLATSASEQASALQETVASADEVSAMIAKNADNAKQSERVSRESQEAVERGKRTVDDMMQSILAIRASNSDILEQVESSNRQVSEISGLIVEIGNNTKIINDIVFQTKLLSFNASVEAARAGEHGKGFAVVAEEVGNLAQMSGNAAKKITEMLDGSIRRVEAIIAESKSKVSQLVEIGRAKVTEGEQIARRCGEVLDEIVAHGQDVNRMVAEISTASQEQAQGVREINKAMNLLDHVTQRNATSADESAESSKRLHSLVGDLRAAIGTLTQEIYAKAAPGDGLASSENRTNALDFSEPRSSVSSVPRVDDDDFTRAA